MLLFIYTQSSVENDMLSNTHPHIANKSPAQPDEVTLHPHAELNEAKNQHTIRLTPNQPRDEPKLSTHVPNRVVDAIAGDAGVRGIFGDRPEQGPRLFG